MFLLVFTTTAINLNDYIDGLENVQYNFNPLNQEVEINASSSSLFLYYQKAKDIKIYTVNQNKQKKVSTNGFHIPQRTTLKIIANWAMHNDYIAGIFDGNNCEYICYTNSADDTIPLHLYLQKKVCIYHLTKNSSITIGDLQYSKVANLDGIRDFAILKSNITESNYQSEKLITQQKQKRTILADYDEGDVVFTQTQNKFTYSLGYIFLALGAFIYIFIALIFGTNVCSCCCGCCCDHEDFLDFVDDRDNGFYTKTLEAFGDIASEASINEVDEN